MPMLLAALAAGLVFWLTAPAAIFSKRPRQPSWVGGQPDAASRSTLGWIRHLRTRPIRSLGQIMARFHKPADRERVALQIARARMDEQVSPDDIYTLKALAVLVPLLYGSVLAVGAGSPEMVVFGLLAVPVLFAVPGVWLTGRVRRYKEQLVRELPSFLNTLAVTVDAGLNLFPALQSVCNRRQGALADEFRELLNGVEVKGLSAEVAFGLLAERCDVDELTLLASALEQALRRGGAGVSQVLREQARTAWGARKKRAEELAQKASFKMFLPLLVLVIPAIGIYMLGPTLILFWGEFTNM